jgi:hypothetical protein
MDPRDKTRRMDGINRTQQRVGEAAAATEKKMRMRRFAWRRKWNDGPYMHADDKRLRLVARRAGIMLPIVEAFVDRLDDYANQNTPRGSVEGFSIEALAAHWSMPNEDVLARIYAALESPDIGWIDQDHIVDFWARNPDTEDSTATPRQQRSRAFRSAMSEIARQARLGQIDAAERAVRETKVLALRERARRGAEDWRLELRDILTLSTGEGLSRCDTVTVTPRADQISNNGDAVDNFGAASSSGGAEQQKTAGANDQAAGLSEGQGGPAADDPQVEANKWLATEGAHIVTVRMMEKRTLAELRVARWRDQQLGGDAVALAGIIRSVADGGHEGARFHALVADSVRRHVELATKGPQFGLMPPSPRPKRRGDETLEDSLRRLEAAVRPPREQAG